MLDEQNYYLLRNLILFLFSYMQGYAEVEELLKKEGICLALTEKLKKDSGVAAAEAYDKVVESLQKKKLARGGCSSHNICSHFVLQNYRL